MAFDSKTLVSCLLLCSACSDDESPEHAGSSTSTTSPSTTADTSTSGDLPEASTSASSDDTGGLDGLPSCPGSDPTPEEAQTFLMLVAGEYLLQAADCSSGAEVAPFTIGSSYALSIDADGFISIESDSVSSEARWDPISSSARCDDATLVLATGLSGGGRILRWAADGSLEEFVLDHGAFMPDPFVCTFTPAP